MSQSDDAPKNSGALTITGAKLPATNDVTIIDVEPLHTEETSEQASGETAGPEQARRWQLPFSAPLAAALACAAVLGGLAGAAATAGLMQPAEPAVSVEARALQSSVAQLGSELASIKASITTTQRTAATQLGKLADRLDRAEKAQAEPTAKLARLQDSIDRLGHTPPLPVPDVTGSVVAKKEDSKPPQIDGWRFRDFHAGRALLQNREGTLYEVVPGADVPGLGRVESIKRENGKVVVTTRNGVVAGAFEPPRRSIYLPFRF